MRKSFLVLAMGLPALAGPIVVGNGTIDIGQYNFTRPGGAGAIVFNGQQLIQVGNNLGTVGAQNNNANFVGIFPGSISGCAVQGAGGGGCAGIPNASFGSGATTMFNSGYSIGLYFSIADPLAADGGASISYNAATATFTNNDPFNDVTGYAGVFLGIHGTFGGQFNAVVGAAIDANIAWNGGGAQNATVVVAGSTLAGLPTSTLFNNGGGFYYNCNNGGINPTYCNDFYAWGVALVNGGQKITINHGGGTLQVTGTLSLIADPMASLIFDLPTDPLLQIPNGTIMPDFGTQIATPEPASAALIGIGLLGLAAVRRFYRWR